MTNSIQVNFSHWPLIGGPFNRPGWPQRSSKCRSPSASRWPQIAAGRRTAGNGEGGSPLYERAPGHPVDFRSRVAMVEPLAPFQIETISLSPLIPPHTHLLLPLFPPQTPGWSFTLRASSLRWPKGPKLVWGPGCSNLDYLCTFGIHLEIKFHEFHPFCLEAPQHEFYFSFCLI